MNAHYSEQARAGIHAHALLALATHITEHQLPTPADIYRPLEEAGWVVDLPSTAVTAWLRTLVIDEETNTEVTPPHGVSYVKTQWQVRLPANGCRFTLTARRAYPLSVGKAAS